MKLSSFDKFSRYGWLLAVASIIVIAPVASAKNEAVSTAPSLPCRVNAEAAATATKSRSPEFNRAISEFQDEMHERHGFSREKLECTFKQVNHNPTVIRLVKPFPSGKPKNWQAYRARFVEPVTLKAGVQFWKRHKKTLARAEQEFGVPAEIIVGIIGVETTYGKNKGNFRIMDALSTLAFDYPPHPKRTDRLALFRTELENALLLSSETGVPALSMKGSYAGAVGWPQFLPSSVRQYAVDYDGDGKIDLVNSPVDAIGSVANFLAQHGWVRELPVVYAASVESACGKTLDEALDNGLKANMTLDEFKPYCVTASAGTPSQYRYGLVDLQNGEQATEYWLGTDNFFAITQYNRSYFYAMAVIRLGETVRKRVQQISKN